MYSCCNKLPGGSSHGRELGSLAVVVGAWETSSLKRMRMNAGSTWQEQESTDPETDSSQKPLEVRLHSCFVDSPTTESLAQRISLYISPSFHLSVSLCTHLSSQPANKQSLSAYCKEGIGLRKRNDWIQP